jgi:hypothetical protein
MSRFQLSKTKSKSSKEKNWRSTKKKKKASPSRRTIIVWLYKRRYQDYFIFKIAIHENKLEKANQKLNEIVAHNK